MKKFDIRPLRSTQITPASFLNFRSVPCLPAGILGVIIWRTLFEIIGPVVQRIEYLPSGRQGFWAGPQ